MNIDEKADFIEERLDVACDSIREFLEKNIKCEGDLITYAQIMIIIAEGMISDAMAKAEKSGDENSVVQYRKFISDVLEIKIEAD